MKNKNCKKEFGSCQCPDCIIPVRNDSSKTWQERFEEEFWGKFGSTKTINEIKQFISQAIDQTREDTIKEVEELLPREKPMNTFSFALGREELQLYMRFKGFNDCRGEIKDALNSLKQ